MKSLVSILIPCYNSEKWLAETIQSALAQTWKKKEIIIVNDGSTDNSSTVAKSFESSIVKVISQKNQGASAARNTALRECQGDFIQYLDADDLLAPNKIELQIELLANNDSKFVASGEWARFYQQPTEALFISEPVWEDMFSVDWLVCSWNGGGMMHPGAWLIPYKVSEKAGAWNENLSLNDDGEYFSRVVLASQGVKFCQGAKTYYRSGITSSLSSSKSEKAYQSAFIALSLSADNLLATENSDRTRHACATVFQRFVHEVYPNLPDLTRIAEVKVNKLGGSNFQPTGGNIFQLFSRIIGWKATKKIHKYSHLIKQYYKFKKIYTN